MKQATGFRLTPRDITLLIWINHFGFVTIKHIATWLGVALPTAYGRTQKLVAQGYLFHERLFHGVSGIYRVSQTGVALSDSALPPLRRVSLATYRHDLMVVELSMALVAKYGGRFIPERVLRHEAGIPYIGQHGHVSDGDFILDDKRIAIEVELSVKSNHRIDLILKHYRSNFNYQEVWYFCGNKYVMNKMRKKTADYSFIKCFDLSDFIIPQQGASS